MTASAGARWAERVDRARRLDECVDALTWSPRSSDRTSVPRTVHRILACIDESAVAGQVLAWSAEMARLFGADLTLLHVIPTAPPRAYYATGGGMGIGAGAFPAPEPPAALREEAQGLLARSKAEVERQVPEAMTLQREGHAAGEIVRAVRELASDLVVMGPHRGTTLGRVLLGSTTDHVKNHAPADLLIARGPPAPGVVVAAVDGSPQSRSAAALADAIARRWGVDLHLLHATPARLPPTEEPAQKPTGVELDQRLGDPRQTIRAAARGMNASVVVVGARGAGGLRSLMPGSVSNALAHDCPSSVLIVRDLPLEG